MEYVPTVCDSTTVEMTVDGEKVLLGLNDTAGGEDYGIAELSLHVLASLTLRMSFEPELAALSVHGERNRLFYRISISVWSTSQRSVADRLRPFVYPNTDVVLVAFKVVGPPSFETIESRVLITTPNLASIDQALQWLAELNQYCPDVPWILVGLVSDLRNDEATIEKLRQRKEAPISIEQGRELAKKLGAAAYCDTSSLHGENVRYGGVHAAVIDRLLLHRETFEVAIRVARCGKRPRVPVKPPAAPHLPPYITPNSTFREGALAAFVQFRNDRLSLLRTHLLSWADFAAVYNNAGSLPDLKFILHTGGTVVWAHTPIVCGLSRAMQSKALAPVRMWYCKVSTEWW